MDAPIIDPPPETTAPGGPVYWLLITMGLAVFAPCILLPEWRTYEALTSREQIERQYVDRWQSTVDGERRMVEGLRSDPAVMARLAQRDLGFRRLEDELIRVSAPGLRSEPPVTNDPMAAALVSPPDWMVPFLQWLPPFPYDNLFCEPHTRLIVMCLGLSSIGAAVVLFGRSTRPVSEA